MQLNHRRLPATLHRATACSTKLRGIRAASSSSTPARVLPWISARAGLVPPAKEQETVFMAPQPHGQQVLRPPLPAVEAQPPQIGHQLRQQVPPQGGDGLSAQSQLPSVEPGHGPEEEGEPHGEGLAAADGPVADDGLPISRAAPPGQHPSLLLGKPHDLSRRPTLLPPRQLPSAPGTALRPPPPFPRSGARTEPPEPGCGQ